MLSIIEHSAGLRVRQVRKLEEAAQLGDALRANAVKVRLGSLMDGLVRHVNARSDRYKRNGKKQRTLRLDTGHGVVWDRGVG